MAFDDLRNTRRLIGSTESGKSGQKKEKSGSQFSAISPPFLSLAHNFGYLSLLNSPKHIQDNCFDLDKMTTVQVVNVSLPALSEGWSAEKDFKAVGTLSGATQRNLEAVGPHFLAHARRVCAH